MLYLRPLIILFVSGTMALTLNEVRSAEINKLITKICLKGFQTEMSLSGKKAPIEIGEYACNCFLKKISSGSGIESAQSICKEEASKKFSI